MSLAAFHAAQANSARIAENAARVKITGDEHVDAMSVLELLLDQAWDDPDVDGKPPRSIAVVAEAWSLEGFNDGSLMLSRSVSLPILLNRVDLARKGRPRRLLRADARGLLAAVYWLIEAGVVTGADAREANRLRWLNRGGHDQ